MLYWADSEREPEKVEGVILLSSISEVFIGEQNQRIGLHVVLPKQTLILGRVVR